MSSDTMLPYQGKTPVVGSEVFIASGVKIIGDVTIGNQSSIWFNSVLRGDVNHIKVGEKTNIQDGTVIHVTHLGNPTIIGNEVTIGHKVMLHACTIKDRCLIGMGATVLDGAIIGEDSLVGACSLVTQNKVFPPNSLIMGSPAKLIRALSADEIKNLKHSAHHYVNIARNYGEKKDQ